MATHLCLIGDAGLIGELHLSRLQYRVLLEYRRLRLVMAKRLLAVQALVEDHTHRPHVHLGGDLGRILANHETLGRKVPGKVKGGYVSNKFRKALKDVP